jgi:hypothetical protein
VGYNPQLGYDMVIDHILIGMHIQVRRICIYTYNYRDTEIGKKPGYHQIKRMLMWKSIYIYNYIYKPSILKWLWIKTLVNW